MVDAKVITQECFDVQLLGRDYSGCVTIECNEEIMRLVNREG